MSNIDAIKAYLCEELAPDLEPSSLPDDCNLLKTGIVDSLSLMRLLIWLEEEFSIPVGDLDIAPDDFSTVLKIDAFIAQHALAVV